MTLKAPDRHSGFGEPFLRHQRRQNAGGIPAPHLQRRRPHELYDFGILYEDCRQHIRVGDLLERVRSQYSAHDGAALLKYENYAGGRYVCVNVVRMIRVVINLLENAARAVGKQWRDTPVV